MKRVMILALALGGCGFFGGGGSSPSADGDRPPEGMSNEQERAYESLSRWLKAAVDKDSETYLGILSAFSKSNYLHNALMSNPNKDILPRSHELPSTFQPEVANWFNFNLRGRRENPEWLVTILPSSIRATEWMTNVMRDYFESLYDETRRAWEGSRISDLPPSEDREGIIFLVLLNNKDPVLVEMRLEEAQWRVNYVKDRGR